MLRGRYGWGWALFAWIAIALILGGALGAVWLFFAMAR